MKPQAVSKLLMKLAEIVERADDSEIERIVRLLALDESAVGRSAKPKGNSSKPPRHRLSDTELEDLLDILNDSDSREIALERLNLAALDRVQLAKLAKLRSVFVVKEDTVEVIKEKVVEATVGSRLRSSAVRGQTP